MSTPPFPSDFPDDWAAHDARPERPVDSAFGPSSAAPFQPPPPPPRPPAPFSQPGPVPPYGQPSPPPPHQQVPYGYQQYGLPGVGPAQTNGFAVTSLVLGIVGIMLFCLYAIPSILAVIFGALALNQFKSEPNRYVGRGMAIAGFVLGLVGICLLLVVIAAGDGWFWT